MYIEIYADILFLMFLVPELLSLALLALWQHRRISFGRLLWVAALSAGVSVAAALLLRQVGFLGLLAADAVIQLLAFRLLFGKLAIRTEFELWILQKLFYLGLGGLLQAGWGQKRLTLPLLLSGFVAGGGLFYGLIRYFRRKKQLEALLFSAELSWRGKSCSALALLDTGNQLYYKAAPVVLISPELAEQLGFCWQTPTEDYRLIPYASVGCPSGLLHGFVCDRLLIKEKQTEESGRTADTEAKEEKERCYERVILGVAERPLSGSGEYQMLLHPDL